MEVLADISAAKLGGLALLSLASLLILRQVKPEWAAFLRIATATVAFGFLLSMIASVVSYLSELVTVGGAVLSGESYDILIRALGISLITELSASICRDSGEASLAGWVEMAGKLELLLLALPLIRTVFDTVMTLLS